MLTDDQLIDLLRPYHGYDPRRITVAIDHDQRTVHVTSAPLHLPEQRERGVVVVVQSSP